MDKGRKRKARVVLRVGGGSRHQLNVSDCSESAASCSETEVLTLDSKTHCDHNSWATPVISSHNEELERLNRTRNELKKEIFGQTFETDERRYSPLHSTPLRAQLVAKHHKRHTQRSRRSQVYPEGVSQLRAHLPGAISASSSDYDEPDFDQVVDDIVFPERPNTVPHVESLHNGQTFVTGKSNKTKRDVLMNGYSSSYNNSSDNCGSPLHTVRSKSADVSSKSRRQVAKLPPLQKRINNQIHPGNVDFLDSPSTCKSPSPLPDAVLGEKEGFGVESTTLDKRLFSTTDSILSATITPLLTSSLRKGGRKPSVGTCFDFDADGQLESCFPDRHLRVFIVTWNMQEQKVCVVCV